MTRIAVFASGGGTNAENLIKNLQKGKVCIVLSDRQNAYVLERAKKLNVPTVIFTRKEWEAGGPDNRIGNILKEYNIELIVLAGFLLKIPAEMIARFPGRIINIHPALLPAFGGKGLYGHHVHKAVLEAGEKKSGITVHLVDEQYDHGQHLFQARCTVDENETPETLAGKIHLLEQTHFPAVVDEYIVKHLERV
jgi:phosphoribosylglycinamide formyltransferase-1